MKYKMFLIPVIFIVLFFYFRTSKKDLRNIAVKKGKYDQFCGAVKKIKQQHGAYTFIIRSQKKDTSISNLASPLAITVGDSVLYIKRKNGAKWIKL